MTTCSSSFYISLEGPMILPFRKVWICRELHVVGFIELTAFTLIQWAWYIWPRLIKFQIGRTYFIFCLGRAESKYSKVSVHKASTYRYLGTISRLLWPWGSTNSRPPSVSRRDSYMYVHVFKERS